MEARKIQQMSEAYAQVYSEQETPMGQHPGKSTNKATRDRYETQRRRNEAPTGVGVPDKSVGYGGLKDDVNFDVIKDYLLDEGFASDEKAALAIMSNMSENWRQSILSELTPLGTRAAGAVDDQRRGSNMAKDMLAIQKNLRKLNRPKGPTVMPTLPGV
tara:strand:+ start:802 stop:1278 length:477 start_codon:yes stop_codon:yes gene_type:complete